MKAAPRQVVGLGVTVVVDNMSAREVRQLVASADLIRDEEARRLGRWAAHIVSGIDVDLHDPPEAARSAAKLHARDVLDALERDIRQRRMTWRAQPKQAAERQASGLRLVSAEGGGR